MMNILELLSAGWLTDFTNWLVAVVKAVWDSFVDFMGDLFLVWLAMTFNTIHAVIELIPAPTFLASNNLQTLFGQAGSTIGWLIATFQIDKCLGVIGTASVFYIVRRILTVGIW